MDCGPVWVPAFKDLVGGGPGDTCALPPAGKQGVGWEKGGPDKMLTWVSAPRLSLSL